jgi:hypothetical protein
MNHPRKPKSKPEQRARTPLPDPPPPDTGGGFLVPSAVATEWVESGELAELIRCLWPSKEE